MTKRRRRTTPSGRRTRKTSQSTVFDGMRPPNHNAQLFFRRRKDKQGQLFPVSNLWQSDGDTPSKAHLLFVDPRHKEQVAWARGSATSEQFVQGLKKLYPEVDPVKVLLLLMRTLDIPPTWMDPEIFLRAIALKDAAVQRELTALRTKKKTSRRELENQLTRLYNEEYQAYAQKRFAKSVGTLAEYLTAYYIYTRSEG